MPASTVARLAHAEARHAQQRRIDHRHRVGGDPERRRTRRAARPRHREAPSTRGEAQPQWSPCTSASGEQRRVASASSADAEQVGQSAAAGRPALGEQPRLAEHAATPHRQVDQEGQPPARQLDERTADRRAEPGRERGRRTPQADRVRAALAASASITMPSDAGTSIAAPSACTTRAAIKQPTDGGGGAQHRGDGEDDHADRRTCAGDRAGRRIDRRRPAARRRPCCRR